MPLTAVEAFRVGFALRCADEGLTKEAMAARVERAAALLEKRAGPLTDVTGAIKNIGSGAQALGSSGLLWGAALPLGAGALGGHLLAKAVGDDVDEEDVRKREMIDELKHWARRAREHKKSRAILPAT
jgi:hypothetical protein